MNRKTQAVYEAIRDEFDKRVVGLTPAEYRDVLDEMASHIESCLDCWKEENPEE